jgi:hypothetical protein
MYFLGPSLPLHEDYGIMLKTKKGPKMKYALLTSLLVTSFNVFALDFTCKSDKYNIEVKSNNKGHRVSLIDNSVLLKIKEQFKNNPDMVKLMEKSYQPQNVLNEDCANMESCNLIEEADYLSLDCKKSKGKISFSTKLKVDEEGKATFSCSYSGKGTSGNSNFNLGDKNLVHCETSAQ